MTVYAVIFGPNDYPAEIDSLWTTKAAAAMRAAVLGSDWRVLELMVEK